MLTQITFTIIISLILSISAKKTTNEGEGFLTWLKSEGVDVSGFRIGRFRGERGVKATRTFEPGEIVAEIPSHLVISEEVAREGLMNLTNSLDHVKLFEKNGRKIEDMLEKISPCDLVTLYLAASSRHVAASRFRAYLDVLPKNPNVPLFMSIDEIVETARHSESIYRILEDGFRTFEKKLGMYRDLYMDMFDVTQKEYEQDFKWGYAMLLSRAWRFTKESSTSPQCYMLPLVDMLNHAENQGEPVALDSGIGVMLKKRVRSGEQLYQDYHITSRCNTESFFLYVVENFLRTLNSVLEQTQTQIRLCRAGES